jgi:site-specific DNA-methyltransferase (adenine-specific)
MTTTTGSDKTSTAPALTVLQGGLADAAPALSLIEGDCLERLRAMPDDSVHAVVTDPPYNISALGEAWDSFPTAVDFQTWCRDWASECRRVLVPGGHLLAFGSPRTYHRLASGVEDAGLEIRDQVVWIKTQGMPKAGGLKPAHEPIVLARKPFRGSCAANVAARGTGALNLAACAIKSDNEMGIGRAAPDVVLTDAVLDDPESEFVRGGGTSGPGRWNTVAREGWRPRSGWSFANRPTRPSDAAVTEAGQLGKSRYFLIGRANTSDRVRSVTGATIDNAHATVKPTRLMEWLVELVSTPGQVVLDPFAGSGSTGLACHSLGRRFVGVERDPHHARIARARLGLAEAA